MGRRKLHFSKMTITKERARTFAGETFQTAELSLK